MALSKLEKTFVYGIVTNEAPSVWRWEIRKGDEVLETGIEPTRDEAIELKQVHLRKYSGRTRS